MRHRTVLLLFLCLGAWLLTSPARAQAPPDYLTEEEVQKVRETQEPNQRIVLFPAIAADRLSKFEQALAARPPAHADDLTELIDAYISAIDDATNNLELSLERGGAKLGKARATIEKEATAFLARLEKADAAKSSRLEEFQFTWDDSFEATRELLEAAKKVPEGEIPEAQPPPVQAEEKERAPGEPTLRKKDEPTPPRPAGPAPPRPRPPQPSPPPPPPNPSAYGPA